MQRLLRFPREPSVAGIMVLGVSGALVLSSPSSIDRFVAAIILLVLHLLSFDAGFNAARSKNLSMLLKAGILNGVPYAVLAMVYPFILEALLGAIAILVIATALLFILGPRHPIAYVVGSLVPALPALSVPAVLGVLTVDGIVFWILYSLYVASTSAYVESRLPYRSFNPWIGFMVWVPALALVAYKPLIIVALVEPTVKLLYNALRTSKVEHNEIRRLGFIELGRLMAFTILLVICLYI